jgi:hypothetical protein
MLRRVALVRTDVAEEHTASIIRVIRTGEPGTAKYVAKKYCVSVVFVAKLSTPSLVVAIDWLSPSVCTLSTLICMNP